MSSTLRQALHRFSAPAPVTSLVLAACWLVYALCAAQSLSLAHPLDNSSVGWSLLFSPPAAVDGQWWRGFTSAFVHTSLTHIVFNSLVIGLIGRHLESLYGPALLAAAVIACPFGGAAASLFWAPLSAMAGASSIGYGLFALLLGHALATRTDVRAVVVLIAVNLGYTLLSPGVSLWGHVGGFLAGVVIALVLTRPRRVLAAWVGAGVVAALYLAVLTSSPWS